MDAEIPQDPQTITSTDALEEQQQELLVTPQDVFNALTSRIAWIIYLTIIGGIVRYLWVRGGDFPLNNGAYFLRMTEALLDNNFRVPAFFVYNFADVPYAHPPLGIYGAALFAAWRDMPLLSVFRWYPMWLSILSIPLFYLLSSDMLRSKVKGVTATLIYMFAPQLMLRLMTGSAVVHGTALLFALFTLHQAFLMVTRREERYVPSTTAGLVLTTLTHGETALFAALTILLLMLVFGRNRFTLIHVLLVTVVALVAIFVWLTPVILVHGIDPFLGAIPAADVFRLDWESLVISNTIFTGEVLLPVIAVMGAFGAFVALAKRNIFLPLWLLMALLVFSDEMQVLAVLPVAMLAAAAVHNWLVPLLLAAAQIRFPDGIAYIDYYSRRQWLRWLNDRLYNLPALLMILLLGAYMVYGSMRVVGAGVNNPAYTLSEAERGAMAWADKYAQGRIYRLTKVEGAPPRTLVLTGTENWRADAVTIWYPLLSGNPSVATVNGSGWYRDWGQTVEAYNRFQACLNQDVDCLLEVESDLLGVSVDALVEGEVAPLYTNIYISQSATGTLIQSVTESNLFERIYLKNNIRVFERDVPVEFLVLGGAS